MAHIIDTRLYYGQNFNYNL